MSNGLHVLPDGTTPERISRRELAKALLGALAAGVALPSPLNSHPVYRHFLSGALLDSADAHLSSENSKPLFLSTEQLHALDVLSEAIVPSSRKAKAAAFIDLLLGADTSEVQHKFLASLSSFHSSSKEKYHTQIEALTPTQLNDLLTEFSAPDSTQHANFIHLKHWVVGAYYSAEIGMRELGWLPDRVFATFPVCTHSDEQK
jgi:hypothetical protein